MNEEVRYIYVTNDNNQEQIIKIFYKYRTWHLYNITSNSFYSFPYDTSFLNANDIIKLISLKQKKPLKGLFLNLTYQSKNNKNL